MNDTYKNVFVSVLMIFCVILEFGLNAHILLQKNKNSNVKEYAAYVDKQSQLTKQLREYDNDSYRVTQTYTRSKSENGLTAYYNDSLAYGYWGLSTYTSTPDGKQLVVFERLGYRNESDTMSIINTTVLPVDSLLGMKYIMSRNDIDIFDKIKLEDVKAMKNTENSENYIYKNSYALPMVFNYKAKGTLPEYENENPFEYQNKIYRYLTGKDIDLYKKIKYSREDVSEKERIYHLEYQVPNHMVYGNLPWNNYFLGHIQTDEKMITDYACFISPSVFLIPNTSKDNNAEVRITTENRIDFQDGKEQFYELDLDVLGEMTDILNRGQKTQYEIKNGKVNIRVDAEEGERLFTSIPSAEGWTITNNGKKIKPELFVDCLYNIELSQGKNEIVMKYEMPGFKVGIAISGMSLLAVIISVVFFSIQHYKK